MEHTTSVGSLMIVVLIAFFIPILLHRLKLKMIPVVVAEIIAGIIIGQSGFNLVSSDQWLELLSTLGLLFLMFLSGVEIDFTIFKRKKSSTKKASRVNPFFAGMLVFTCMLLLALGASIFMVHLGLIEEPLLMTVILSSISLGIVVPVLKERELLDQPFGQTVLITAVVSDFLTMILFAYYLAHQADNSEQMILLVVLLVAVLIIYRVVQRIKDKKIYQSLKEGTAQIGTRGVFALILFFVALSESIGMENILGAFLAGVIVSLIAPNQNFVRRLDSFGYGFLIPIFFVMVGVNFDLRTLLDDRSALVLIPVMLVFLYIVRVVPTLILRKWFPWKETIGSGVLLASTLSVAIVAASVSLDLGFISPSLNSAIILIVILSCFISPIVFNRMIPKQEKTQKKMTIVGANQITLPTSLDFKSEGYDVRVFATKETRLEVAGQTEVKEDDRFPIIELDDVNEETLAEQNAFDVDVMIIGTSHYDWNIALARKAKEYGVEQIVVRSEDPQYEEELFLEGFQVFSTLTSSRMLLRAIVGNSGLMQMFTRRNDKIQEIVLNNPKYEQLPIRNLPYLGDTLILQIYRNEESIVPNGDTKLTLGDRMIVSGSIESLQQMRAELE